MTEPWIDTITGKLWTPAPGGRPFRPAGPSTRNDALWEAHRVERASFVALAHAWREAAIADGWHAEPTYGDHEPVEQAWRLTRDGYSIQGISRPGDDKTLPSADVHIWGPDSLAIDPPLIYSMDAIRADARKCGYCGATDVDTSRVGFAGRCCDTCMPTVKPAIEQPGWTE